MFIAQVFLVIFSLFAFSRVVIRFRKREISYGWFIFWIMFWISAVVVVILPQTTTILAEKVGIGRGADLAVYFSIFILFYLSFRIFVKMENMERTITKFVEGEALDKFSAKSGPVSEKDHENNA